MGIRMDEILVQLEKEVEEERRRRYVDRYGLLNKDHKLTDFEKPETDPEQKHQGAR
ncbi:hypothetical protein GF351_03000 [Candidatus Woesearchaeota archaeon]|nr:hypothetical protein [Candidatus Woesearchaeota archaeon]